MLRKIVTNVNNYYVPIFWYSDEATLNPLAREGGFAVQEMETVSFQQWVCNSRTLVSRVVGEI